jgi:hypothetical protein
MTNSINTIRPYRWHGQWVFDDPAKGLSHEALVGGMDTMIDLATAGIPGAAQGFIALFSEIPFPGHQIRLDWLTEETGGNVYWWEEQRMRGWLCPALLKYFKEPPNHLYIQVKEAK